MLGTLCMMNEPAYIALLHLKQELIFKLTVDTKQQLNILLIARYLSPTPERNILLLSC